MRIRMLATAQEFEGTAEEIVRQMQSDAFVPGPLATYMDWLAVNTSRYRGIELDTRGRTIGEKAESLVQSLLEWGLATELPSGVSAFQ